MKKMYIAICVDEYGDTLTVRNTIYEDLIDSVDAHGFDVLDIVEWDFDEWFKTGYLLYK